MKHMRLVYSNFVSTRPEPTTLLELWCMIGGFCLVAFIANDSGMGFSGVPKFETILALTFPAIFFFLHYMSREFSWFKGGLVLSVFGGMVVSSFLFIFPYESRSPLPNSDIALMIFCAVSLLLITTKPMRN